MNRAEHSTSSVLLAQDSDAERWDTFVSSQSDALFFHRYDWKPLIEGTYGHKGYYLWVQRAKEVAGILPLFLFKGKLGHRCLISVPQADYAGVCAVDHEARDVLLEAALKLAKDLSAQYVELRHLGLGLDHLPSNDTRVAPLLLLPDSKEGLWKQLSNKMRNQVRKAQKSNVSVRHAQADETRAFWRVFVANMRRLGSPSPPQAFFSAILRHFQSDAALLVATLNDRVIGGLLCLFHGGTIEVPWASSLPEYFHLCPNNALYWEAMCVAIDRGCTLLHFGSSPVGSGTYHFKMQWGAEAVPLRFQYLKNTSLPPLGDRQERLSYKVFRTVWRKLPLAVTNRLGPVINRKGKSPP